MPACSGNIIVSYRKPWLTAKITKVLLWKFLKSSCLEQVWPETWVKMKVSLQTATVSLPHSPSAHCLSPALKKGIKDKMVTCDSTPTKKVGWQRCRLTLITEVTWGSVVLWFSYARLKYNMIPSGPERPVGPSLAVLLWINCPCSCLHHAR